MGGAQGVMLRLAKKWDFSRHGRQGELGLGECPLQRHWSAVWRQSMEIKTRWVRPGSLHPRALGTSDLP